MKLAIVSLGCPKNQVDADVFCRSLLQAGHETVPETRLADLIIINTCGFVQAAKEEAIEYILDACSLKKENPRLKVVVTGCLAERYRAEMAEEMPEVDAIVGIGKNGELAEVVARLAEETGRQGLPMQYFGPKTDLAFSRQRVIGTPAHYAYLKIAEGCSNACSYCAIPLIRGPMRSREMQECLDEAAWLADQGVRELILVAQDVTAYGEDMGQAGAIISLLDALNTIEGIRWIRILYAYPERINEEFLDAMQRNEKVVPYLDLPIQHCNDEILRSMRRRGGAGAVREAVRLIRQKMPHMALRTSLIVGYPGESEAQFEELCQFVKEVGFERLGCFAYSEEEGTKAAEMKEQLPAEIRAKRAEILMELQSRILQEKQEARVGQTLTVLCDGWDEEEERWNCRTALDAAEIDTMVYVVGEAPLAPGGFYEVRIKRADAYDLFGTYVKDVV